MVPLEYALAVALLTAPTDAPPPPAGAAALVNVRPALRALAISCEVLDRRENYVLKRDDEFLSDLHLVRRRYRDLYDAPPLEDCQRFPARSLVNDLLSFNRAYRQHLDNRQPLETTFAWELHEALQETDRLYLVWDTVRDARCDYYYVTVRRQALKKLRELIGDEAYYNGSLPPHVPVWRFTRVD